VGTTSVAAVGEVVEVVGEDLEVLREAVVNEDPAVLGKAAVTEAWRWMRRRGHVRHGPSGGWRGAGRGPDRRSVRHRRWTRRRSARCRWCRRGGDRGARA
jgi:hypothetical protein